MRLRTNRVSRESAARKGDAITQRNSTAVAELVLSLTPFWNKGADHPESHPTLYPYALIALAINCHKKRYELRDYFAETRNHAVY